MKAGFFPGQGSQQVGMGKQFYDEFTVFRQSIEEASDSLSFNLKKLRVSIKARTERGTWGFRRPHTQWR